MAGVVLGFTVAIANVVRAAEPTVRKGIVAADLRARSGRRVGIEVVRTRRRIGLGQDHFRTRRFRFDLACCDPSPRTRRGG